MERKANKIYVPPIKCQGIKTKLVQWILENVKLSNNGRWLEPFMGSGVVGFNAMHKHAIFNDINPHIINFYNALKQGDFTPQVARAFLSEEGGILSEKGEEHFYFIRERFNREKNPLDFLFLSRSCFNGMIRFNRKGFYNVPFCRKPNRFSKSYITKIVNQIEFVYKSLMIYNWEFYNKDFKEIISMATPEDFIYCDPPYFARHVDYFNSWSEKEEMELFECLKSTKAHFILSTWFGNKFRENPSVKSSWSNFNIITKEHFYHVGGKLENRNSMTEGLVLNYTPIVVSHDRREHIILPQLF